MARSLVDKVMWVGRATVFAVGLVAIFALLLGVAYVAFSTLSGSSDQRDAIPPQVGIDSGADQTLALEALARRQQIEIPRGYAQVDVTATTVTLSGSKGINGVQRSSNPDKSEYCFDLTFVPKVAVASAHFNNNATVGTILGTGVPSTCPTGFRDAAAKTYAADTGVPNREVNFRIIFI